MLAVNVLATVNELAVVNMNASAAALPTQTRFIILSPGLTKSGMRRYSEALLAMEAYICLWRARKCLQLISSEEMRSSARFEQTRRASNVGAYEMRRIPDHVFADALGDPTSLVY